MTSPLTSVVALWSAPAHDRATVVCTCVHMYVLVFLCWWCFYSRARKSCLKFRNIFGDTRLKCFGRGLELSKNLHYGMMHIPRGHARTNMHKLILTHTVPHSEVVEHPAHRVRHDHAAKGKDPGKRWAHVCNQFKHRSRFSLIRTHHVP